jgi:chromosome segregation ATPase
VVGNPKVPEPNYGPTKPDPGADGLFETAIKEQATAIAAQLAESEKEFATLDANLSSLEARETITDAQWEAVDAERQAARDKYNSTVSIAIGTLRETYNAASATVKTAYKPVLDKITTFAQGIVFQAVQAKSRINQLANKRQGVPPLGGTQGSEGE